MSHVEDLAKRVEGMTVDQLLELAAALVVRGRLDLAEPIAQRAADDLTALRLLRMGQTGTR